MKKIALLMIIILLYITNVFSQKSGVFNPNLVLTSSRTLTLAKPGSTYSQVTYSLQPEVAASTEKEIYNIEFDLISNESGKKPFTNMVVGKSPQGDIWSFRIDHSLFTKTNNVDGSLHYTYTFIVDRANNYDFGKNQRFISEVNNAVGCQISNLKVTYKEDQTIKQNLIVDRNIGVNGRIGIGVDFPSVALDVSGTIRSKEVKIEATGWADFVFDKDYELPSLNEVANYIQTNNTLPGIPSEKEVLENGIDLGDMQLKLLQKIEELTLYMIAQDKRIEALEKENKQLKNQQP
jgi:hypothetical protein